MPQLYRVGTRRTHLSAQPHLPRSNSTRPRCSLYLQRGLFCWPISVSDALSTSTRWKPRPPLSTPPRCFTPILTPHQTPLVLTLPVLSTSHHLGLHYPSPGHSQLSPELLQWPPNQVPSISRSWRCKPFPSSRAHRAWLLL